MMIKKFFLTLLLILGLAAPLPAFAADPYGGIDCSGAASNSTICKTRGQTANPLTGPTGTLSKVTNVIAFFAGAAAILFIIFAGIQYITAQGDPQQISKAKQSIIYASVGIVIILLARQIITFVLSKI